MDVIVSVALDIPLRRTFDYLLPEKLCHNAVLPPVGSRVKVPFKKSEQVAIILAYPKNSEIAFENLKTIHDVLEEHSVFSEEVLKLCYFASDYYHAPIGEVLFAALPQRLRLGKKWPVLSDQNDKNELETTLQFELSEDQKISVETILKAQAHYQSFLLQGITGSGKTEVYLQLVAATLQANKQALILVPEIGLTPQTVQRFAARFSCPIAYLHSNLNETERATAWAMAFSGKAKIIIGTRSAIFVSLPQLGIIIVDEEHDPSFKQQEGFRYHARDLAIWRAHYRNIPIVLGSATPALETLAQAIKGRYQWLHLTTRPGQAVAANFYLLDLRRQRLKSGLSKALLMAIEKQLDQDKQVLLFINRRGYAPVLLCRSCGWIADCQHCEAHLTLHREDNYLLCHHCEYRMLPPSACPNCQSSHLSMKGLGTERLEQTLIAEFPDAEVLRIDRDSMRRKMAFVETLSRIKNGKRQILIGTQMLAKGHHFPNVTLVAIVEADSGLFSSDFRALERLGQLIIQVAGRAGRADHPGQVYIQTYNPEHPLLHHLLHEGYNAFAEKLLKERFDATLPPYRHFALWRGAARDANRLWNLLAALKNGGEKQWQVNEGETPELLTLPDLQILGPIPAPLARKADFHRAQLVISAANRRLLRSAILNLLTVWETLPHQQIRWGIDIDPIEFG